jgi:hypothetical protein
VPLHGLSVEGGEDEDILGISQFDQWVLRKKVIVGGTSADAAGREVLDATESIVADIATQMVVGVAGKLFGKTSQKTEAKPELRYEPTLNTRKVGYILTNRRIMRRLADKWETFTFDSIVHIEKVHIVVGRNNATQVLFRNNIGVQYRMKYAEVHAELLAYSTDRYRDEHLLPTEMELATKARSLYSTEAARACQEIAASLERKGDIRGASSYFERATRSPEAGSVATAWIQLGNLWFRQSKVDQETDAFTQPALDRARDATYEARGVCLAD